MSRTCGSDHHFLQRFVVNDAAGFATRFLLRVRTYTTCTCGNGYQQKACFEFYLHFFLSFLVTSLIFYCHSDRQPEPHLFVLSAIVASAISPHVMLRKDIGAKRNRRTSFQKPTLVWFFTIHRKSFLFSQLDQPLSWGRVISTFKSGRYSGFHSSSPSSRICKTFGHLAFSDICGEENNMVTAAGTAQAFHLIPLHKEQRSLVSKLGAKV